MMAAAGRMGWTEAEFWACTPRYFHNAWTGFELNQREHWERSRWITAAMLQPHAKKGRRIRPTDITVFPWEETTVLTEDRAAKMAKIWSEMLKQSEQLPES